MLLSTDETVGYKVMDTTAQVAYDIQNCSGLMNRSQWRLRFAKNVPVQATNICYYSDWAMGTATQAKKPYLDLTYLYN